MKTITLSVPEDLYKRMKKHKEIKWSEVFKEAVRKYLMRLESKISTKEILDTLPKDLIKDLDEENWIGFYGKLKEKERWRYMTHLCSSKEKEK